LAIVGGESIRHIAARYRLSPTAVQRHKADHLAAGVVEAKQAADEARALDVMEELRQVFETLHKLRGACDVWLTDPADSSRYTLEPRAEEVEVVYWEWDPDGVKRRKKVPASALIERFEDKGLEVEHWETKHADIRELTVKVVAQLGQQIELLAELIGELDKRPQVNVLLAPEWLVVRTAMLLALQPYPEARASVSTSLLTLEAPSQDGSRVRK
jgi:hypothetical protein